MCKMVAASRQGFAHLRDPHVDPIDVVRNVGLMIQISRGRQRTGSSN